MSDDPDCTCGHPLLDHHVSWFAGTGQRLVEECENEECQMMDWNDQCAHYRAVSK